jgi:hypothetical protein
MAFIRKAERAPIFGADARGIEEVAVGVGAVGVAKGALSVSPHPASVTSNVSAPSSAISRDRPRVEARPAMRHPFSMRRWQLSVSMIYNAPAAQT